MKQETKSEIFEFLMNWLLEEQKEAAVNEAKIDEVYKNNASGTIDIFGSKCLAMKIELAGNHAKIMRIKAELTELAELDK